MESTNGAAPARDDLGPRDGTVAFWRLVLIAGVAVFLVLQLWILYRPGGTLELYGFWGSFDAFAKVSLADPITAAGFVDLVGLMPPLIIVFANGVPKGPGYGWKLAGLIVVLIVWPALAMLLFLIAFWRRKGQFRPERR